ncbi:methylated-DNA-[protein]-cysteine S-methyltransferase [Paenibacillus sp. UNC496MF]|uniref:methylated-DNA--[protein]-cysteine S-methyltransferase n=1 Tax=Paenibacillus sp. UNC496MF TaxID=1502753 RepID=UPI0008EDD86E|nr:methylated-DNA--[protein]-cysteine S-methyltransferase [Paenibacillus sp. UNC496MF]SFI38203.1 methylated-DNA-[protein]-cysteine S-methyltransferase [Paenibacillus sp. UNC496MF]
MPAERSAAEVAWTTFEHGFFEGRPIRLAATETGLCLVTLPGESFDRWQSVLRKRIPGAAFAEDAVRMAPYVRELDEYLAGGRKAFAVPTDYRGTPFQMAVWRELGRIPFGETRSYSELAAALGKEAAVRAVGAANGANPMPIVVPCHRLIGKDGALTGFRGGMRMKEALLRLEGFGDFAARGHERYRF